jgi:phosphoserine phosphatase
MWRPSHRRSCFKFDFDHGAIRQERRDMMNRMFELQQAFNTVHEAAKKILVSLDTSQHKNATTRLPGLVGPGRNIMGAYRPTPRSP